MKDLTKRSITTERGEIFYFSTKNFPGKPTVVFLHGLSSNHTTWESNMAVLEANNYNTLALDMRGHGYSDKRKEKRAYKFEVFRKDLEMIVEKEHITDFTLVGYSFGGEVALEYAVKDSSLIKNLILISVNYMNPFQYKKIYFLRRAAVYLVDFMGFICLLDTRKKFWYYEHSEAKGYWESTLDGFRTMPLPVNFWMLREMFFVDFKDTLSQIQSPVYLIHSKSDPFVSEKELEDMESKLKDPHIIESANTSHFIASQAQSEISDIILNILKKDENSDI